MILLMLNVYMAGKYSDGVAHKNDSYADAYLLLFKGCKRYTGKKELRGINSFARLLCRCRVARSCCQVQLARVVAN